MRQTKFELSLDTKRDRQQVFAYISEPEHLKSWMSGLMDFRAVPVNQPGPGFIYEQIVYVRGKSELIRADILNYRPDELFTFRIQTFAYTVTTSLHLEATSEGTRIRYAEELIPRTFLFKLLLPLVAALMRMKQKDDFGRLIKLLGE